MGVFPPLSIVRELENGIDDWRKNLADRSVKWVSAEKIHLTLCFLGSVDLERVDALAQELKRALSVHERLSLNISGLGVFPNLKRPRVLWAGATGEVEKLLDIQRSVLSACAPFMESADDKAFSAHVTLARLKDPGRETTGAVQRIVDSALDRSFGEWPIDEVLLVRSELGGKGSTYSTLASYSLAKSG